MAFGIKREELLAWKAQVNNGEIAIITHFWEDPRFPRCTSVTKIGCSNVARLVEWGENYNLKKEWIHYNDFPHFDVFGLKQKEILINENKNDQFKRFLCRT